MPRKYSSIIAATITTIISIILIMGVNIRELKILAGICLVLILPGYSLMKFVTSFENKLRIVDQFLLALGMSIPVDILTGLMLNLSLWGLNTNSWALSLGGIVISLNVLSFLRNRTGDNPYLKISQRKIYLSHSSILQLSILLISGIIILLAFELTRIGAENQPRTSFTQLWIQPTIQTDSYIASIGIKSFEEKRTEFRLQILMDGKTRKEWNSIDLEPDQEWENSIGFPTLESSNVNVIEAELYRLEDEENTPYRRVLLWKSN